MREKEMEGVRGSGIEEGGKKEKCEGGGVGGRVKGSEGYGRCA